jgi:immunity protein Imm1 of predicted polymorphic toxin system
MFAEVAWRSTVEVNSIAEVDQSLDAIYKEISSERPQAIHITRTNGDCLSVVLGAVDGSVLSFVGQTGDPPYFVSLGDPAAKGVLTYFLWPDHHTEALARNVVPEMEARQAVREFVSLSSGLPKNITWTEV